MPKTFSHSHPGVPGGSDFSATIEDRRQLADDPRTADEVLADAIGSVDPSSIPGSNIPPGRRRGMVQYLTSLRAKFREQGLTSLAADIDRVFESDGVAAGVGEPFSDPAVSVAAMELGRRGGNRGGRARAAKMSPEARRECARNAARARWDRIKSGESP